MTISAYTPVRLMVHPHAINDNICEYPHAINDISTISANTFGAQHAEQRGNVQTDQAAGEGRAVCELLVRGGCVASHSQGMDC